jgi:hypothetical protein
MDTSLAEFRKMTFLRRFWLGTPDKACKKKFSVISVSTKMQKVNGTGFSHFRPVNDTWQECKLFLRIFFGFGG